MSTPEAATPIAARPVNAGISAEAQHVVNALEAHFAAVRSALDGGVDAKTLVANVDRAWGEVRDALAEWGDLEFAAAGRDFGAVPSGGGKSSGVSSSPSGK
jgi:hypothetical protein